MEAEYELEQRRSREAVANARKHERQYKELMALMEDDKRQIAELTGLCDSLNIKIKTYRRQIDEAVSFHGLNHTAGVGFLLTLY